MKEVVICDKCGEEATYQSTTPDGVRSYACPNGHDTGLKDMKKWWKHEQ